MYNLRIFWYEMYQKQFKLEEEKHHHHGARGGNHHHFRVKYQHHHSYKKGVLSSSNSPDCPNCETATSPLLPLFKNTTQGVGSIISPPEGFATFPPTSLKFLSCEKQRIWIGKWYHQTPGGGGDERGGDGPQEKLMLDYL